MLTVRRRLRDVPTLAHALAVIVVVEVLVRSIPLPRLGHLLGCPVDLSAPSAAERLPMRTLPVAARRQLRCAHRVAEAWPFSTGPCLRRALVGGHLLRRYHPSVRLGIAGSGDRLTAHAWLEIHDRPLEDVVPYHTFHLAGPAPRP